MPEAHQLSDQEAAGIDIHQELHLCGDPVDNGLTGNQMVGVEERGAQVIRLEVGVVFQNFLPGRALGQQLQNHFHRNAQATNQRLAAKNFRVEGNPSAHNGG